MGFEDLSLVQYLLGGLSGGLVGVTLGLFGGGSILAVPLLVYLVGVPSAHMAIGTSALAVAANAASGLVNHARHGSVCWRPAILFSIAGMFGAWAGSSFGKIVDGDRLLFLFAILMMVVAVLMFRKKKDGGPSRGDSSGRRSAAVLGAGGLTGMLSGFFGIGGGFLIVPSLMATTGMSILYAVGTSLVAVTAFGLTTALNYAFSGFMDWPLAAVLIGGGILGSIVGERLARHLSQKGGRLNSAFAVLVFAVAIYMAIESALS